MQRQVFIMFNSSLKNELNSFLELRKTIVGDGIYKHDMMTLALLDKFMLNQNYNYKYLSEELITSWQLTLAGKTKTIKEKIGTIRNFTKYLNSMGYSSFMPKQPIVKSDYIPYIYTDQEVAQIIHYADNLKVEYFNNDNLLTLIAIPVILRILYGCGTRLSETLSIKRKHINFSDNTILLVDTKFQKERLIPIHKSLADILEQYCETIGIINKEKSYLFPGHKDNTHLSKKCVQIWFKRILEKSNIDQQKTNSDRGACLHCFRHLFVLKSMQQLEKAGHSVDINDLILPTYLGHDCMIDTDKYMKFSGVQIPKTLEVFEDFTSNLLPNVEVHYEEE